MNNFLNKFLIDYFFNTFLIFFVRLIKEHALLSGGGGLRLSKMERRLFQKSGGGRVGVVKGEVLTTQRTISH